MDENPQVREVIQNLLGRLKDKQVRRVRVINLSLFDHRINPDELTQTLESLTLDTVAQDAHWHIRWVDNSPSNPASNQLSPNQPSTPIQVDSVELG